MNCPVLLAAALSNQLEPYITRRNPPAPLIIYQLDYWDWGNTWGGALVNIRGGRVPTSPVTYCTTREGADQELHKPPKSEREPLSDREQPLRPKHKYTPVKEHHCRQASCLYPLPE